MVSDPEDPMIPLANLTRFTLGFALLAAALASLWLVAVPDTLAPSTYAVFAALVTALAAVALLTYKNGQAAGSMGHLLHETDITASTAAVRAPAAPDQSRSKA
jgi:hypothetical protein